MGLQTVQTSLHRGNKRAGGAVACVAARKHLLLYSSPPAQPPQELWRGEACPLSQPGWGRADPSNMQASLWAGLRPPNPNVAAVSRASAGQGAGVKHPREVNGNPARACEEPRVLSSTSKSSANPVGSSFKIQPAPAHCLPLPPPYPA